MSGDQPLATKTLDGHGRDTNDLANLSSSHSGWRPGTGPYPPSSAARSTREPSRELPPSSAGVCSNLDAGFDVAGSTGRRSKRSSSRGPRISSVSRERGVVLSMMDEEITRLHPEHETTVNQVQHLKKQLKAARLEEQREAREQSMNKAERLQRRLKVTSRMQACVRGWLVRKRVIAALDHRTVQNLRHAAMLPDLLREQLMQLQHGVHDLKYKPEGKVVAAVKLQAWWRSIAARRVVKVVQLSNLLQAIGGQMAKAATVIQAWFRGATTKLKWRNAIISRMLATREQQYRDMVTALRSIVQIQRGYRAKLARRMLTEVRGCATVEIEPRESPIPSRASVDEEETKALLIDTWAPATTPGAVPLSSGNAGVIVESPPRHDWEIEKVESTGLVPFYGASSERMIRHQIGGPAAFMMQQQLAVPGGLSDDRSHLDMDGDTSLGDCDSLQEVISNTWEIYPSGLTPGFLPSLDADVWEHGGRAKSYRNSLRLRGVRKSSRRKKLDCRPRPCTKVVTLPPSNAEERALIRDTRSNSCIGAKAADITSMDCHPMFINAPPQPALRAAPNVRSARFFHQGDDEEWLWGDNCVAQAPTYRSERRPRGMKDENLWSGLNVPFDADLKKPKPGEVSHERVWSIAHALAQQLPALTAG